MEDNSQEVIVTLKAEIYDLGKQLQASGENFNTLVNAAAEATGRTEFEDLQDLVKAIIALKPEEAKDAKGSDVS